MGKTKESPVQDTGLAITEIAVGRFKSIVDEQKIEIRPLTILAGANSSGKSSMMQPLLLLKQTLEASYDPGPLLLNGPNAKFTSTEQLLSRTNGSNSLDSFHVAVGLSNGCLLKTTFRKEHRSQFRVANMEVTVALNGAPLELWPQMTSAEIKAAFAASHQYLSKEWLETNKERWKIAPRRCFLEPSLLVSWPDSSSLIPSPARVTAFWDTAIPRVIHLRGLRGSPERTYSSTSVGPTFPGSFEIYTASLIAQWASEKHEILSRLGADLKLLGLAGGVTAVPVNAAQVEIFVGRFPGVGTARLDDRVSIADVGVGVSQTLPVLVALHAADPGTLVFVEQPETHLHPRAQFAMAQVLAAAAKRGVRVVIETHSTLLLLGVQALVAEGKLEPEKVKLHWFQRDKHGRTNVASGDLDEAGRFGNWPQDFDDVTLNAEKAYLDAADLRLLGK